MLRLRSELKELFSVKANFQIISKIYSLSPSPKTQLLVLLRWSKRLSKPVDCLVESTVEGRTLLYLANTKPHVVTCTITTCYENLPLPDSAMMFPLRLQHSLHLITGQNLPQIAMPSNMPHLDNHYADPRQALRAHEVFVTGFKVRYGTYSRGH